MGGGGSIWDVHIEFSQGVIIDGGGNAGTVEEVWTMGELALVPKDFSRSPGI